MGLGLSSGGASIPTVGPSKFSLMQSRMIFGRNNFSLTTNTTLHNTYTAEADFDWVQLGYFNFTLSSVAIDRAAIAHPHRSMTTSRPSLARGRTSHSITAAPLAFRRLLRALQPVSPSPQVPARVMISFPALRGPIGCRCRRWRAPIARPLICRC